MTSVIETLELPPEERAIADAWVAAPEFQKFSDWYVKVLRVAWAEGDGPVEARALGKVLECIGKKLQEVADHWQNVQ